MPVGITNFQAIFQTYYDQDTLPWLVPNNLPFFNLIPKQDGLSGDVIDHVFKYGPAQGFSADFNTAMASASAAPKSARAALRCSQAYAGVEFFDKDKALTDGEAAYADLVTEVMTSKLMDFYKNLDLEFHGTGTGWRGTVAAGPGMVNPFAPNGAVLGANQVAIAQGMALETVFDQDQLVQPATYAGFPTAASIFPPADGRTPTTLGNAVQIVAVDGVNRVITLSDATSFTANTFILQAGGAIGFNSSNINGAIIGMDSWNPYGGVTTTDSFLSINRSPFPTRMAGYWMDGSRFAIEDAIKRLSARMSQGGARESNVGLINPMDFDAVDSKLGTNVRYGTVQTATYGFDSIVINGAAGRIDLLPDPHQPQGYARIIDPSTWVLNHKYAVPHIVDVENRTMEQGANFDGRTARLRFYGQLRCKQPHKNGIVKLPSVII